MFAACFLEATILRLQSSAQALPLSLGVCDASSGFSAALFLVGFVPALFLAVMADGVQQRGSDPRLQVAIIPRRRVGTGCGSVCWGGHLVIRQLAPCDHWWCGGLVLLPLGGVCPSW